MSKVEENREAFAERAAQSLENGVVPWRQEGLPTEPQQNGVSGRSYNGLNALFLMEAAGTEKYRDPRWMTHKDAENHGFKPRMGEKSTKLEFWDKDDAGTPVARTYSVFNIQQFYGQEFGPAKTEDRQPNPTKVEEFFQKVGMEPPADRGTENCRKAIQDLLVSAAGKNENMNKIPSPQLKELRMSIAGTFLMQEAGVPLDVPANAPTKDWATTVRLNPKELFRAAKDASRLTNEILGRTRNQERSESKTLSQESGVGADKKPFEPEVGQRVTFQPNDGKSKLTGKVLEMDENSVTLQCGRTTIPALRDKGVFTEALEPEATHTKEYAREQAQKHVGERGNVFTAKGEDAVYKGAVVELTPTYAIQKVGEDAIVHRLKDLESCKEMIREGAEVSITKGVKGAVTAEPWNREQEGRGQKQNQAHEGAAR
jgi:antirestriction protein ArdC